MRDTPTALHYRLVIGEIQYLIRGGRRIIGCLIRRHPTAGSWDRHNHNHILAQRQILAQRACTIKQPLHQSLRFVEVRNRRRRCCVRTGDPRWPDARNGLLSCDSPERRAPSRPPRCRWKYSSRFPATIVPSLPGSVTLQGYGRNRAHPSNRSVTWPSTIVGSPGRRGAGCNSCAGKHLGKKRKDDRRTRVNAPGGRGVLSTFVGMPCPDGDRRAAT